MQTEPSYKMLDGMGGDLVVAGLVTPEQLAVAKVSQEDLGVDLAQILIQKKFVTEEQILQFLSQALHIPFVSLAETTIYPETVKRVPLALAKRYTVFPLRQDGEKIVVAMANPLELAALDDLKAVLHAEVDPVLSSRGEILEAIDHYYSSDWRREASEKGDSPKGVSHNGVSPKGDSPKGVSHNGVPPKGLSDLEVIGIGDDEGMTGLSEKLQEIASGPKIVASVNQMISRAYSERASDIHIEPVQDSLRVRYRIDGFLEEKQVLPRPMHLPIISRIKIMAGLDIAERRIPQDGRIRISLLGNRLDLRVSTYPTTKGEKVAIRLLSKENLITIEDLGFSEKDRKLFSELVAKSYGLFLVTGPTGSGKSTTLYGGLLRINSPEKNIVSIEDPVESEIPGVNQAQVNPKAGITFATALRAILRQDPNVVMIGEIRDAETADIAVRAAMTGHMVLSTLHTNTASGALSRLLDLGVESFLLSSALVGILNQRLVRRICTHCREEVSIDKTRLGPWVKLVKTAFRGQGCSHCRMTGYKGRVGLFELAPINDVIRDLIYRKASDTEVRDQLRKMGVKDIREDGFEKVNAGMTTLEEVLRVTEEVV
ncbi:MAG: type II/IV secretion system protein [Deltaproteobacteria bacterium]|nr:type II/IV secretion system protein [Deltaproteobacteria bacterium]